MTENKKVSRKVKSAEPEYAMPVEVKNWIDSASSRLKHMQNEIDRLKDENEKLKAYRRFAEQRILRSEYE